MRCLLFLFLHECKLSSFLLFLHKCKLHCLLLCCCTLRVLRSGRRFRSRRFGLLLLASCKLSLSRGQLRQLSLSILGGIRSLLFSLQRADLLLHAGNRLGQCLAHVVLAQRELQLLQGLCVQAQRFQPILGLLV